jgi:hypothetical protein
MIGASFFETMPLDQRFRIASFIAAICSGLKAKAMVSRRHLIG